MTPYGAPSHEDVRQKFLDILDGRISREDASTWANTWVVEEKAEVDDPVVWEALKALSGVDLRVNSTEYLHNEADIHRWLNPVEKAIGPDADD